MSGHVYVRLSGFGATITPCAPFRISRSGADGAGLRVTCANGEASLDCSRGLPAPVRGVVDVSKGTFAGSWRLETSVYASPWPTAFDLVSTLDEASAAGYDLIGPMGSVIYVQGPFRLTRLPALDSVVGPGQAVCARGTAGALDWIRLSYEHEGAAWEQAHMLVRLPAFGLAVTSQAPQVMADEAFAAARTVAAGLCALVST